MPRILFAMHQETGHLNCTFKIARGLKQRGHQVRYFATADLGLEIRAQGFETVPWFPDLFPAGYQEREARLGVVSLRRLIAGRYMAVAQRILSGELDPELGAADVVLSDVVEPLPGMRCRQLKLPLMLVSTALPQTYEQGIPPLRCAALSGAEIRWWSMLAKRRTLGLLAGTVGACPPYLATERIAAAFALGDGDIDRRTAFMPQIRGVPELVLCPEAFDLPRPPSPLRHYVESIDLQRNESAFDWSRMEAGRPLIYCSMGTARYRPAAVAGFLQSLVRTMRSRPDLQLLIATGRHPPPAERPSNVAVVRRAPQMQVLRRASAMITHAGLGSVKEAISCAVPMIAVPLAVDQPGNAARIRSHGIGVVTSLQSRPSSLNSAIDRLLHAPEIRDAVDRIRTAFCQTEDRPRGVDLIHAAARG